MTDKFSSDGQALPYPGNTIVCAVPAGSPAHAALTGLQQELRDGPWAECFAFLPPGSFHMTLYRGVNHLRRLPEEWPRDLALDLPLQDVTEEFTRRLAGLDLGSGFSMRPVRLYSNPTGESQLMLKGRTAEDHDAMHRLRQRIGEALNHSRPGDENYRFHITFSYQVRPLTAQWRAGLDERHQRLFSQFSAVCPSFQVGPPHFCRYDTMLSFIPVAGEKRDRF